VEIDSCALVSDGAFCALWEHRLKMDMGVLRLLALLSLLLVQTYK
jgi:hypothetical protein